MVTMGKTYPGEGAYVPPSVVQAAGSELADEEAGAATEFETAKAVTRSLTDLLIQLRKRDASLAAAVAAVDEFDPVQTPRQLRSSSAFAFSIADDSDAEADCDFERGFPDSDSEVSDRTNGFHSTCGHSCQRSAFAWILFF